MESQKEKADALLEAATETQLRNVLVMAGIPDAVLIALFEREQRMNAVEAAAPVAGAERKPIRTFSQKRGI